MSRSNRLNKVHVRLSLFMPFPSPFWMRGMGDRKERGGDMGWRQISIFPSYQHCSMGRGGDEIGETMRWGWWGWWLKCWWRWNMVVKYGVEHNEKWWTFKFVRDDQLYNNCNYIITHNYNNCISFHLRKDIVIIKLLKVYIKTKIKLIVLALHELMIPNFQSH